MTETADRKLRAQRAAAGLSQRELARISGIPQPNIAAYETGRRAPSPETRARLETALRTPTLDRVRASRDELRAAARRNKVGDVRVFGSIARGEATDASDVDLLVHPAEDASVFDLAAFMSEAEQILGLKVDVVSDRGTGLVIDRIRQEATAL